MSSLVASWFTKTTLVTHFISSNSSPISIDDNTDNKHVSSTLPYISSSSSPISTDNDTDDKYVSSTLPYISSSSSPISTDNDTDDKYVSSTLLNSVTPSNEKPDTTEATNDLLMKTTTKASTTLVTKEQSKSESGKLLLNSPLLFCFINIHFSLKR